MDALTNSSHFTIRRKVLQLLGGSFEIFNDKEELVMFASQKAFKLKEDIRLYSDKEKTTELVVIHARNIIDFSATYDVTDAQSGAKIGALKRSGFKSLLKDEWVLFDSNEQEIGKLHEDNKLLAFLRRFVSNLIPQTYHVYNTKGEAIAEFNRNFNPFVSKITVDFAYGAPQQMDKRLGLALGVLLTAIEGKQS